MAETPSVPESTRKITREQVIATYKKFVAKGITSPDDLDPGDPEVQEANKLFYAWVQQEDSRVQKDPRVRHEVNLSKTMLYVDAGFTNRDYLDEILNDQLIQKGDDVLGETDEAVKAKMRGQIKRARAKIRKLLKEPSKKE